MLFVTGTGTDIGKTYITALLLSQLCASGRRGLAWKPILSGFDPDRPEDSDAGMLLKAMGAEVSVENLDRISPWRFRAPLSPDMAARREGRRIDFAELVDFSRRCVDAGTCLIEGVGGAMVPIDDRRCVLDWMKVLGAPVLLVAGTYLGAISHCLTTVAVIRQAGLDIRAIILNRSVDEPVSASETAETIARFTGLPIRIVPRDGSGETLPDLTDLAL